jgi:nucleoside-diphosphate-sugar epimerase
MRIFLTGATGFAGSHLVERLLADGHQLFALVHVATSHQQLPVHPLVQEIPGDLLNLPSLKRAVATSWPCRTGFPGRVLAGPRLYPGGECRRDS